jgi:hypothetical protein
MKYSFGSAMLKAVLPNVTIVLVSESMMMAILTRRMTPVHRSGVRHKLVRRSLAGLI